MDANEVSLNESVPQLQDVKTLREPKRNETRSSAIQSKRCDLNFNWFK